MLKGKKIVLGVTGGIAVYKAVDLVSRLRKQGAEVRVVMTEHAQEFVTRLHLRKSAVIRLPYPCGKAIRSLMSNILR